MQYKWGSSTLGSSGGNVTWSFGKVGSGKFYDFDAQISETAYQAAIRSAFQTWADVANIKFVEVSTAGSAQIQLGWDRIDGAYNVLGEASYSWNGSYVLQHAEVRFDMGEAWSANGQGGDVNFYAVAVHEIGHTLGLEHSDHGDSIMYAYMTDQHELSAHDIEDIREIYGAATGDASIAPVSDAPTVGSTPSPSGNQTSIHILTGDRDRYDIRLDADSILIRDLKAGSSANPIRLSDIERLVFDDGNLAFDIDGNAGMAYRLYQAAFDRVPDLEGLGFWIDAMDVGARDAMTMSAGFIGSLEFQGKYGASGQVSESDFVGLLYANVLDRTPDASEVAYWVNRFDGNDERAKLLAFFADSVENRDNVLPAIDHGIWYL